MAITQGAHHIGLTVPNLTAARDFFVNILDFTHLLEVPDYPAFFVSDGTIVLTLWQAADSQRATLFDRLNVIGLHHFALKGDRRDTCILGHVVKLYKGHRENP